MSESDQPRDFAPETGGWILFVGGPRDGIYIQLPPLKDSILVKEFRPYLSHRRDLMVEDEDNFSDTGEIKDHVYNMESLWYGRSKTKWFIMLDASLRSKQPDLPKILAAERRALERALPKIERCALPLRGGPLADDPKKWRLWNEKAAK